MKAMCMLINIRIKSFINKILFGIFEKGYTVIWLSKSESKESYTEWNKPNREQVWLCLYVESKKFKFIQKDRKMRIFRNLR